MRTRKHAHWVLLPRNCIYLSKKSKGRALRWNINWNPLTQNCCDWSVLQWYFSHTLTTSVVCQSYWRALRSAWALANQNRQMAISCYFKQKGKHRVLCVIKHWKHPRLLKEIQSVEVSSKRGSVNSCTCGFVRSTDKIFPTSKISEKIFDCFDLQG